MSDRVLVMNQTTRTRWVQEATAVTAGCGHRCWLSPGSRALFFDVDVDSICAECFGGDDAMRAALKDGRAAPASPEEALAEVIRHWPTHG